MTQRVINNIRLNELVIIFFSFSGSVDKLALHHDHRGDQPADLTPKAESILREMLRTEYEFYHFLDKRLSHQLAEIQI